MYVVFSDGGFRSRSDKAAAAWIVVEFKRPPREARIIATGSKLLGKCIFSFMAEAIAVEEAAKTVQRMMIPGPHTEHGILTPYNTFQRKLISRS